MSRTIWTRPAQADLARIDVHNAAFDPSYADRVGRAAIAAGRFLRDYPAAGPVLDGYVRKWSVPDTDYLLIYRIVDDGVEILRVNHAREDWRP